MAAEGLVRFSWIKLRIIANGPTGISMWAVTSFAAKASKESFPSESCCINILADIVINNATS